MKTPALALTWIITVADVVEYWNGCEFLSHSHSWEENREGNVKFT